ncbi:hypothetical protein BABINDRAFT_162814 [Babjeviella inositovora NRRL Y-12698]|uniref:Uncharacterized protein n=1 Tax=Babjeviella inositovora NRRL Y-12698 TaxID=984486 RepID=A0A1E3QKC9_9ASCO|nr:uncharacterized protein BABINDRAFT_162814 [Babjeviella inositovora NRRL Y-12698]ODQ78141.1 hypothetical protein BABINDRAFT_162814 [Babjeviella inositovora NRRL Y-12698]
MAPLVYIAPEKRRVQSHFCTPQLLLQSVANYNFISILAKDFEKRDNLKLEGLAEGIPDKSESLLVFNTTHDFFFASADKESPLEK